MELSETRHSNSPLAEFTKFSRTRRALSRLRHGFESRWGRQFSSSGAPPNAPHNAPQGPAKVATQLATVLILCASPLQAQGFGPGTTLGVVDWPALSIQINGATITGWAFHTGGAAILKVRVWLDCNPFTGAPCAHAQLPAYTFGYARPDVVTYFPQYPVPENSGWMTALYPWFSMPDGEHWLFAGATDAEHGPNAWTQINPVCFTKWGGNVLPCGIPGPIIY